MLGSRPVRRQYVGMSGKIHSYSTADILTHATVLNAAYTPSNFASRRINAGNSSHPAGFEPGCVVMSTGDVDYIQVTTVNNMWCRWMVMRMTHLP